MKSSEMPIKQLRDYWMQAYCAAIQSPWGYNVEPSQLKDAAVDIANLAIRELKSL